MRSKDKAEYMIVEYLSNPENGFLSRQDLSTQVLGYKSPKQIHNLFTGRELDRIEARALEIRRSRYARLLAAVDLGVLKKAASGDTPAAKLAYQRFEGWTEKMRVKSETGEDLALALQIALEKAHGKSGN